MPSSDDHRPTGLEKQLTLLRERVTGVRGVVVAATDGLLVAHEGAINHDPHDLAALAAAAYGIARQSGQILQQGDHQQTAIHNANGHYVVYTVNDQALLAVVAEAGLNIAQLNLQVRASTPELDRALREEAGLAPYRLELASE